MHYKIVSTHIDFDNETTDPLKKKNIVTVLIECNSKGDCKAYRSNHKTLAGYPTHNTSVISMEVFQNVAATGIKVYRDEAEKFFPGKEFFE